VKRLIFLSLILSQAISAPCRHDGSSAKPSDDADGCAGSQGTEGNQSRAVTAKPKPNKRAAQNGGPLAFERYLL
jgi:hypothetical protein